MSNFFDVARYLIIIITQLNQHVSFKYTFILFSLFISKSDTMKKDRFKREPRIPMHLLNSQKKRFKDSNRRSLIKKEKPWRQSTPIERVVWNCVTKCDNKLLYFTFFFLYHWGWDTGELLFSSYPYRVDLNLWMDHLATNNGLVNVLDEAFTPKLHLWIDRMIIQRYI